MNNIILRDLKPLSKLYSNFSKPDTYYLTIQPLSSFRDYEYGYYETNKNTGVITFIKKLK